MYFPVRPQRFPAALWRHRDDRHPWRFRRREFDIRCGALIFLTNRGFKLLAQFSLKIRCFLAKGQSARLSRRQRCDFRPSRARARATPPQNPQKRPSALIPETSSLVTPPSSAESGTNRAAAGDVAITILTAG